MLNIIFRKSNVIKIFEKVFAKKCLNAKLINQGFYGWVFLIEAADDLKVIAKIYKSEGYITSEVRQLEMIRKYVHIMVPEVYAADFKMNNGCFDVLFMEYIQGVNAAALVLSGRKEIMAFSNQVIENLLAIHQVTNPAGFGSYVSNDFNLNWENYYKAHITKVYNEVHSRNFFKFSKKSAALMELLYENFDNVFSEAVSESHLIHGDYNLWNLIADPNSKKLLAVIDPFGSCFADRELDLFQLTNANGDRYGLLDNYKSHVKLSDCFELKNAYYFFWDDMKHMVNMGYCDNKRFLKNGEFVKNNL